MKHLFALLLLLLAVSSAWSTAPTHTEAGHVDQVAYLQHQEAALPSALVQDQRDLVGIHLVGSAAPGSRLEAPRPESANHVAILVELTDAPFDAPTTAIQTPVTWKPLSGFRRPIETPGPTTLDALTGLRCRGGIPSALTAHVAIHTSGA